MRKGLFPSFVVWMRIVVWLSVLVRLWMWLKLPALMLIVVMRGDPKGVVIMYVGTDVFVVSSITAAQVAYADRVSITSHNKRKE
jgi:hypothetical protein